MQFRILSRALGVNPSSCVPTRRCLEVFFKQDLVIEARMSFLKRTRLFVSCQRNSLPPRLTGDVEVTKTLACYLGEHLRIQ